MEKSPYMRRTLASPIFAISSNSPSTIFAEALSASMRTARRGERGFRRHDGIPKIDGDERCPDWETEGHVLRLAHDEAHKSRHSATAKQ